MDNNGQAREGGSGISSSKRGRKSGKKAKEPKKRQRGMGIAQLEILRFQTQMEAQMEAAADANVAGRSFVPNNLHDVPLYSITSPDQLHEGTRVQNPYYLSPLPPSFSYAPTPMTAPFLEGPQGVKGDLSSFQMPSDSSSPCFWHTSDPAPSSTPYQLNYPQNTKMSMDKEGCGLLEPSKRWNEEEDDNIDLDFRPPNYFTNLLLAEDTDKEEMEQKDKKARTDSSGAGSSTAAGSSSSQESDLELQLFF